MTYKWSQNLITLSFFIQYNIKILGKCQDYKWYIFFSKSLFQLLFIGVPEDTTIQVEGRGFQADEPTDFDEYLKSVTKATVGKNARALQFDENSAAPKNNGLVMSTILILLCFAIVFWDLENNQWMI